MLSVSPDTEMKNYRTREHRCRLRRTRKDYQNCARVRYLHARGASFSAFHQQQTKLTKNNTVQVLSDYLQHFVYVQSVAFVDHFDMPVEFLKKHKLETFETQLHHRMLFHSRSPQIVDEHREPWSYRRGLCFVTHSSCGQIVHVKFPLVCQVLQDTIKIY